MLERVVGALSLLAVGPIGLATAGDAAAAPGAVVVELFTAQGCSSCPPAERALSRLGTDESTRSRIVPLAYHVDYWNEGGWIDPFGAREWSLRQEAYGRALGAGGPYTPQLVVDGRAQFPGGDERRARAEIAGALERSPAVRLGLTARKREGQRSEVTIDLTAQATENIPARKLRVLVALFENRLTTAVERGENGGRTLESEYVVRRLETALSLDPKAGSRKQGSVAFKLDRAWRPENIGVAAFVQDPTSMRIYGAATLPSLD